MAKSSQEYKVADHNSTYDAKDTESMMLKYRQRYESFGNTVRPYPINTNCPLFGGDFDAKEVYKHMTQTYPICHGGVLSLAHQFLLLKRQYGSDVEKKVYKDMNLIQFFDRISTKRAVVFYQKFDSYLLRTGQKGTANWEAIGTDVENIDGGPLLSEYLSYDELLIASLCGISSPTHFINNGTRRNHGRTDKNNDIYPMTGIYMGLIGARFEKQYVMEHSLMAITKAQNTQEYGYGTYKKDTNNDLKRVQKAIDEEYCLNGIAASKAQFKGSKPLVRNIFESFYSREYLPLYDEVKANCNGDDIDNEEKQKALDRWYFEPRGWGNKRYLDKDMFRRRIRISLELFLFESDLRCKENNKSGFCHLVGLGSGYWSFDKELQDREMVKVVLSIIKDSDLVNISCVYFSWFDDQCMMDESNNVFVTKSDVYYELDRNKKKIVIEFGDRNPADKLEGEFAECLICACYAWDSNAFPGNEYYLGSNMLSASGDPAAAACSTIPYVQNAMINEEYITGKNTMFYFFDGKTGKYECHKLKDIDFDVNKDEWLRKSVLSIPYKRDTLQKQNNDNDDEKSNKSNL